MERKGAPDIIGRLVSVQSIASPLCFSCRMYIRKCRVDQMGTIMAPAVNNAGVINKNKKLWEVTEEEFDAVFDTNVKGTINVMQHFLPLMVEKKKGIIVNFSSGWGRSGAALVSS